MVSPITTPLIKKSSKTMTEKSLVRWTFPGFGCPLTSNKDAIWAVFATKSGSNSITPSKFYFNSIIYFIHPVYFFLFCNKFIFFD
jgi:hypothetical protein